MHRLKRARLLLAAVTIFVAGIAIFLLINKPSQENPIPESVRKQVDYSLYYPSKLSKEFNFEEIAFDQETKVVTYKYSSTDKSILFSLQKKPDNFDFNGFNQQMVGVREIKTPVGTASAGTLQNQTVSSLLTDSTWILITAGPGTNIDDLEKASKSLDMAQ